MIPFRLTMYNFMCYRDNVPSLHFDGIHLACLAGDNGNGKSSIIDAVTWALWGQARSKSDDDLIHSGQAAMEVEFDFAVSNQMYRVIRKRSRPKKQRSAGQSILELQIATNGSFRSISGNTIAQTQQKIIDILHMDYATFINSAYLRQGHADEFTTQPPARRKEVLGNILGLAIYDELEAQARDMARQQDAEKAQLASTITDISSELARKPDYEIGLEQAQHELGHIEEVIKEHETSRNELRGQKESLEKKKTQLDQLIIKMDDTSTNLKSWEEQSARHNARIKEYQELMTNRTAIEDGFARFTEAKKQFSELDSKFRQSVNLERQKSQLESKIREASQSLTTEHALVRSKISELELWAGKLDTFKNQWQQLQIRLRQLSEQDAILQEKKQTLSDMQAQINHMESNQQQLEREIREIDEKLHLLSTQTEARCPLCETELAAEGLKLIESKYTAEKGEKAASLQQNQEELAAKRDELNYQQKEVSQTEGQLNREKTDGQGKAQVLNKDIAEAEEAAGNLAREQARLGDIEERLARREFATTEQQVLAEVEKELGTIAYDAEQHELVRDSLTGLEHFDQSRRKLDEADRLMNQEREAAFGAEESARRLLHSLEADNQVRQSLTTEVASLPRLLEELEQADRVYQEVVEQRTQAQEKVWQVRARVQRCTELEQKKTEMEKQITLATRQENIYKDLAKAFGKGGIQALLIEMVLPEIEAEANRLLGRMTDNRMHVKFETQRETKKGNTVETLDINISDELGTRNYEMFSGGEAFRIDFAIRIAMSKLLAKRAGAPLPTLIIDEGFGTQDNTGLEKLKEAINSIQDDFDKIIVITHIEELRDAFPTRIDVIKTAEGSTLSVS